MESPLCKENKIWPEAVITNRTLRESGRPENGKKEFAGVYQTAGQACGAGRGSASGINRLRRGSLRILSSTASGAAESRIIPASEGAAGSTTLEPALASPVPRSRADPSPRHPTARRPAHILSSPHLPVPPLRQRFWIRRTPRAAPSTAATAQLRL